MTDYAAIADTALRSSHAVIGRWLPEGKRQGREYLARNPRRTDHKPGSFSVNLDTGAWADFASGDKGGDLVSLVAYLDGTRQGPAAVALANFLGMPVNGTDRGATALNQGTTAKPAPATRKETWRAILPVPGDAPAPPAIHPRLGTPAATWTYLDPEGRTLCLVLRFETAKGKEFRPLTYCENTGGARAWRWAGPPEPRPLYGLDRLAAYPAATVIVCEGEKAADAASLLLPAPEFVTLASLNGAQSPGKSDWSPLAGRTVIVWPDHDEPGQHFALKVRRLAQDAGAVAVDILNLPLPHPETDEAGAARLSVGHAPWKRPKHDQGWDAADALAEGFTPDHLRLVLDCPEVYLLRADHIIHAEKGEAKADQAAAVTALKSGDSPYQLIEFKKGYRNGVYFFGEDAEGEPLPPLLICSPLRITARTRDPRNGNWGYLLEWADPDGHPHQWAMPAELLSGAGDEYRSVLLDGGLYIAPGTKVRNHLASYIQGAHTEARARCTDRTGWHGPAFVLPDRVIGPQEGERVIFQSAAGAVGYYGTAGTLDGWRREVAALASGNSRLLFTISTALASILLDLSGDENGGFHLQGTSSEGKSSALYAAASVFGARDFLHRWRATSNGLEAIATAHSGALLILDELGQVDPKEAGEIAYMLANGTGKHRADRTGGARRSQSWRLLFLSSGEIDLAQHMLSIGKRARAGQEARLLSFAANPGAGLGLYDDLRGFADGAALSRAVDERTRQHYGMAGPAFIEAVAGDLARLPAILRDVQQSFLDAHLPVEASGQVHRAAGRFALVAVGGELATRYGITGWQTGEAGQAAATCFRSWLDGRGGSGDREATAILAQVRHFFEAHGEARFHDWDHPNERPIVNRAGVRRQEGETWTYYVLPETFREEVCTGFDTKAAVKVLDAAGLLVRGSDGRPAALHRLPGVGPTRCYQIRPFDERNT